MKPDSENYLYPEYERLQSKYERVVKILRGLQHKKYFSETDRRLINATLAEVDGKT